MMSRSDRLRFVKVYWPIAIAAALMATVRVVQWQCYGRQADSSEIQAAVSRLARIDARSGEWEGRSVPIDSRELAAAEIAGCLSMSYARPDGQAASLLLVCGRPGPISAHTPEYCFVGAGLEMQGTPRRIEVYDAGIEGSASFWWADFLRPDPVAPRRCRAYWSWSDGGPWRSEAEGRFAFAAAPALHKLYVVREMPPGIDVDSTGLGFIRDILPSLRRAFPPPEARGISTQASM